MICTSRLALAGLLTLLPVFACEGITGDRSEDTSINETDGGSDKADEVVDCDSPGFASDASSWSLPDLIQGGDWMSQLSTNESCGSGSVRAMTMDMTCLLYTSPSPRD